MVGPYRLDDSRPEIDRLVAELLPEAGACGRFPTPVDDPAIARHLRISPPEESPLAPEVPAAAPADLQRRIQVFRGKLLGILDRPQRAIRLAPPSLEVHRRFNTCHELGHDLCPWHHVPHYLDSQAQLAPHARPLRARGQLCRSAACSSRTCSRRSRATSRGAWPA